MRLLLAEWVMIQHTSATNRHGQIHGVQGLYVADNSVLPTLTAAGPVLSNVLWL